MPMIKRQKVSQQPSLQNNGYRFFTLQDEVWRQALLQSDVQEDYPRSTAHQLDVHCHGNVV